MGAKVTGYALDPQPHEVLFNQLDLGSRMAADHRGDIRDLEEITRIVAKTQPEIIFHLAAQPLVRLSYEIPVETFSTNVMGTAHLLEAVRTADVECRVVAVTTDKCYENREWLHAYREEDAMGGYDPYSASKGAAELVISSYRRSYFASTGRVIVASARAGNVIGGGDWARDRIIPDCIRAVRSGHAIPVRNKLATRPWQHVLEPLSGYLWLGSCLENRPQLAGAYNFGPALSSNRTVMELATELTKHIGGTCEDRSDPNALHEASLLNLATDKAYHQLGWSPVWNFEETIEATADWYLGEKRGMAVGDITQKQIAAYCSSAASKRLPWALD